MRIKITSERNGAHSNNSVIKRNRSKSVELLANTYDHVFHTFVKGFTLLTLGWTDGYSFIPANFAMLSSSKKANRYIMDTWFTNEPMIKTILKEGLDVIGMVKQLKQLYNYKGRYCRLEELRTLLPKNTTSDILGSVIAETVKCQLQQWIASQASFIQALFGNLSWES